MPDNAPHRALRHHVSEAVERGEAESIVEIPATITLELPLSDAYWLERQLQVIVYSETASPVDTKPAARLARTMSELLAR